MNTLLRDELIRNLAADMSLAEVERALRELFGLAGAVLLRDRNGSTEIFPPAGAGRPAGHCAAVRATPEGQRRCAACQTSIALRAPFDGLSQHRCHSGACILAAPAKGARPKVADMLVVSTGAFVRERSELPAIFHNLVRLPMSRDCAQRACESLPVLSDSDLSKVKRFLVIASAVVGRTLESVLCRTNMTRMPMNGVPTPSGVDRALQAVFSYSSDANAYVQAPRTGNRIIDGIVEVVTRTPEMQFTLEKLAVAAGLSPNHLSTLFHRHYGKRFSEFLVEQRVRAAMRRLHDPQQSVEEVARLSGFNDVSYFCRCFKQHTGSTPGEWRRRLGLSVPPVADRHSANATPVP